MERQLKFLICSIYLQTGSYYILEVLSKVKSKASSLPKSFDCNRIEKVVRGLQVNFLTINTLQRCYQQQQQQ